MQENSHCHYKNKGNDQGHYRTATVLSYLQPHKITRTPKISILLLARFISSFSNIKSQEKNLNL